MHQRLTAAAVAGLLVAVGGAPRGLAEPLPDPGPEPAQLPPPNALIASGSPGVLTSPDGWVLTVSAKDESLEPVDSLTNSPWSREYLVDGTFAGAVTGSGTTKLAGGTLEAGYQIGCGINQDDIESVTGVTVTPGFGIPVNTGTIFPAFLGLTVTEQIKIDLKPGAINIVPVGKKSFKGTKSRVSITGFRIKVDGCAGQSFIRSYATFTSSTDNTDDVVTYLGVTRAV